MKISVFGTGYVGLVSGVCFADFGSYVTCVDVDENKIELLNNGKVPIYELGLQDVFERNVKAGRLHFTTSSKEAVESADVIFIAVGTPALENGEADMSYVCQVGEDIGRYMERYKVIVNKSTVPVGSGQQVKKIIERQLEERKSGLMFDIVSNPEFLREGKGIQDFTHPDRIIIGVESKKAEEIMKIVYRPLYINETPFIATNIETAEMIKYASNAFLATKITFINQIANLCEKVGANVQQVAKAMGRDGRISPKFLHAGPGFGGSCFPKDTRALASIAQRYGVDMSLVKATIKANQNQRMRMVEKIIENVGDLGGKTVGVLGLAFKPDTNDMRESPSITIIRELAARGAIFKVYDPESMEEARREFSDINSQITYCRHAYDVAEEADLLVLLTEWHEFRNMDLCFLKKIMKSAVFFDLRNVYVREYVEKEGLKYFGVGA